MNDSITKTLLNIALVLLIVILLLLIYGGIKNVIKSESVVETVLQEEPINKIQEFIDDSPRGEPMNAEEFLRKIEGERK